MDDQLTSITGDSATTWVEAPVISAGSLLERPPAVPRDDTAFPTGFNPLDEVLGGGLIRQDVIVVAGRPGVGKTMATLQWGRSMAMSGVTVVYFSYEHDEHQLLERLLMLEIRELAEEHELSAFEGKLRLMVRRIAMGVDSATSINPEAHVLQRGIARVRSYADRLLIVRSSGASTNLKEIARVVDERRNGSTAVFVDHIHKVPNGPDPMPEAEHMARIAGGLKDLALSRDVGVVAVGTVTQPGLTVPRAHLHHLRGAEAIAYETDVMFVLNEKATAVSKAHRAYDSVRAREFRRHVVFSVEKNRRGEALLDLEFRKDFGYSRFDPQGSFVAERLVDELLEEV